MKLQTQKHCTDMIMSELTGKVSKGNLLISSQAQRSQLALLLTHRRAQVPRPAPTVYTLMPLEVLQARSSKALSYAPQAPPCHPHPTSAAPLGFPSPTNDPLQAPPPFTTSTVPTLLSFPTLLLHTPPIHFTLLIPVNPSTSPLSLTFATHRLR